MRRYSEAVKADIRKRMSPPARQSVARISEETGIPICTLYAWRKGWRLEGEVVPASQKDPDGWSAADKFTVVLETAGLNATELSAYRQERGLCRVQVSGFSPTSVQCPYVWVVCCDQHQAARAASRQDQPDRAAGHARRPRSAGSGCCRPWHRSQFLSAQPGAPGGAAGSGRS